MEVTEKKKNTLTAKVKKRDGCSHSNILEFSTQSLTINLATDFERKVNMSSHNTYRRAHETWIVTFTDKALLYKKRFQKQTIYIQFPRFWMATLTFTPPQPKKALLKLSLTPVNLQLPNARWFPHTRPIYR